MIGFNPKVIAERKLTTLILLILFISSGYLFNLASWPRESGFPGMLGMASFLLSTFVGVMAFIKFLTRRKNKYLFIGSGFLAASIVEGYSLTVSLGLADTLWSAGRILLSSFLLLSLKDWKEGEGVQRVLRPRVYISAICSAVLIIAAVTLLPSFNPYWQFLIFSRPLEITAMILFGFAAFGYWQKGYWKFKFFEFWFVLSLLAAVFGQANMAMSLRSLDAMFYAGYMFKLLSYLFALVGLLMSNYAAYKEIEAEKKIHAGHTSGEWLTKEQSK